MLTKSPAARTALVYVTIGALVIIWTTVWYIYMRNNPPESSWPFYFVAGLAATGITMLCIGFGVGRLGSSARNADNPTIVTTPPGTTTAVVGPPADESAPAAVVQQPVAVAGRAVPTAAPAIPATMPRVVIH